MRRLRRAPGFTLTILLTLALTIGANAAVFSALDAVLLEPMPFPDPDRLVYVSQTARGDSIDNVGPARLEDWNERSSTFEALTGYYTEDVSDTSGEFPERLRQANVAPRFFDVWQVAPAIGRGFVDADHEPGAALVVVISARYWERRFDSNADVIGSTLRIGGNARTIVGVMDPGFAFADKDVDLWVPVVYFDYVLFRRNAWYAGYGRMRQGVSIEQAGADLERVQAQLAGEFPDTDRDIGVLIEPLKDRTVGGASASLWLLFGAVTVLLLIACTNIAALLLARAAGRRHDMAVRLALGSSRLAVAMQTLTEAAALVVFGAGLGLLFAAGATTAFRRIAPSMPRIDEVAVDGGALLYTLVTIVVVTLLCGLMPALRSARRAEGRSLAGGGRGHVASRHSLQWSLVGVQVALSVMLLAGAGLLIRSFQEISAVDPGFEARNVLTFRVTGTYGEEVGVSQVARRLLPELAAMPGVTGAATSTPVPGVLNDRSGFDIGSAEFLIDGAADLPENRARAEIRYVSPEYFDVMRIPLLAGETCRRREDGRDSDIVVNRSFASRYFSDRSPIGRTLTLPGPGDRGRVVAVSGNARELGTNRSPVPTAYRCIPAIAYPPLSFIVRTEGAPEETINAIRRRVEELEPTRSLYDFMTLEQRIGAEYAAERLRTVLIALFAAAALALVCLGIYGTLSYIVSLRHREIGLRMALGAQQAGIVGQLVTRAMRVVGIAAAAGLLGSLALSGTLSGMLFGVAPNDPVTLGFVIGIVALVGLGAALLPALHASRIAPIVALRED